MVLLCGPATERWAERDLRGDSTVTRRQYLVVFWVSWFGARLCGQRREPLFSVLGGRSGVWSATCGALARLRR